MGGGVVVDGQVLEGAHGIGGEWGHNPLPGMTPRRMARSARSAIAASAAASSMVSGPALAADFQRHEGRRLQDWTAEKIAGSETPQARAAMARWMERLAPRAGLRGQYSGSRCDRAGRRAVQYRTVSIAICRRWWKAMPSRRKPRRASSRTCMAIPAACAARPGCGIYDALSLRYMRA